MHNNRTSISLKSNVEIKQTLVIISLKGRGLRDIPASKGTAGHQINPSPSPLRGGDGD